MRRTPGRHPRRPPRLPAACGGALAPTSRAADPPRGWAWSGAGDRRVTLAAAGLVSGARSPLLQTSKIELRCVPSTGWGYPFTPHLLFTCLARDVEADSAGHRESRGTWRTGVCPDGRCTATGGGR